MKAKEFAQKFNDDPSIETLVDIGNTFLIECAELGKARNCQSDDSMIAIFEEQNRKWKAFARLVDGVKEDGFEQLLKLNAPPAYAAWKYYRAVNAPPN